MNRFPLVRWVLVATIGLTVGLGASITDVHSLGGDRRWILLANTLNATSAWAAIAVAAGLLCGRAGAAALAGAFSQVVAVFAYYGHGATVGLYQGYDPNLLAIKTFGWSAVAVCVGPLLGLVGYLARGRGAAALVAGMTVPALICLEVAMIGLAPPLVAGPVVLVAGGSLLLLGIGAINAVFVLIRYLLVLAAEPTGNDGIGRPRVAVDGSIPPRGGRADTVPIGG